METCEWCGEAFETREAEDIFESETFLDYNNIKKCLCGECAVKAIEDQEDGVYFVTCEECGRTFDLIEDESIFRDHFSWYNGTTLRDYWEGPILCAYCAIEKADADSNDEEYEDDDYNDERISASEAADIWLSHGKDEDYMFGYTEEELEDAL